MKQNYKKGTFRRGEGEARRKRKLKSPRSAHADANDAVCASRTPSVDDSAVSATCVEAAHQQLGHPKWDAPHS